MGAPFRVEHATWSSRIGLALFAVLVLALAAAPVWADRQQLPGLGGAVGELQVLVGRRLGE